MDSSIYALKQIIKSTQTDEDKLYSPILIANIKKELGMTDQEFATAFINAVISLHNSNIELEKKLFDLKGKMNLAKFEIYELKNSGKSNNKQIAAQMVKAGAVPARKNQADIEVIEKLKMIGLSDEEIASKLGVSRSTIWRRRVEAERRNGINLFNTR